MKAQGVVSELKKGLEEQEEKSANQIKILEVIPMVIANYGSET